MGRDSLGQTIPQLVHLPLDQNRPRRQLPEAVRQTFPDVLSLWLGDHTPPAINPPIEKLLDFHSIAI